MVESRSDGRVRYGLDAPGPLLGTLIAGGITLVVGLTVTRLALVPGVVLLAYGAFHLWGSAVGKVKVGRRLLAAIPWNGNETVLDIGCGHGMLLIEAATRFTEGKVVGIDIWSEKDQWRNSAEAVVQNVRRAGLSERAFVQSADARDLPFRDRAFDVVVSSLVVHNIPDATQRDRAIHEMARILKPGGHVAIVDLAHTARYARVLREAGMSHVHRSSPVPLFSPVARAVTARR